MQKKNLSSRALLFVMMMLLALTFTGSILFPPAKALAVQDEIKLQILTLNDFHGALEPRTLQGKPIGGAAVLAGYLNKWEDDAQAQGAATFRVHAGDAIGASPPVSALLQDEPTLKFLEVARFVYGCPGNHEFDEGREEFLRLQNGGPHPKTEPYTGVWPGTRVHHYLCANVVDKQTQKPIFSPYAISMVQGVPVGFIGAVLKDTPTIVLPSGVASLDFLAEAPAVNKYVDELKNQGVETIIVLLHQGGKGDRQGGPVSGEVVNIVEALDDEVDVVISGHTHQSYWGTVDGKLITQAYANGTAFADIDLVIDPVTKDVTAKTARIVDTWHEGAPSVDQEVYNLVSYYQQLVAPIVNQVIANAAYDLTREQNAAGESALGNLIADAQRWKMGTDLAFMNPGGIRANLSAGEVTWGELYTIQPFGNNLVKMKLSGSQIDTLLEQQWKDQPYPRILQVSGLSYTWDPKKPAGERVDPADVFVNGQPLELNKTYIVTVNSFLAEGGDKFSVLKEGTEREMGPADLEALIEYLRQLPQPFGAAIEGRINIPLNIFIQVTDLHLSDFADAQNVFQAKYDPLKYAPVFVEEIKSLKPSFVVATGDLVAKAEAYPLEKGLAWFDLYRQNIAQPITQAGIPFYHVPGNHDVGGTKYYKKIEDVPPDLRKYYGDGLFTQKTGSPTFYSFDVGDYHYIVLDPVEVKRTVRLPEEQLSWLKNDLKTNQEKNIVLFFHQPSPNWENWEEVKEILAGYKVKMLFGGHWHTNTAVESGFPEQATSSFCGCWWRETAGKDGVPLGYRLVYPLPGGLRHFYKELGASEQINILSPVDVALTENTPLVVQAFDAQEPIQKISYRVDGGRKQPMFLEKVGLWYEGKINLEINPDGNYHKIEVVYQTPGGKTFTKTQWYKFAPEKTISIGEIHAYFDRFKGRYATIKATVTAAFADGQLPVMEDETGGITVWAGECAGRPEFYEGQGLVLRGKVSTDGWDLQQLHLNYARDVQVGGTPWLPTPRVLEVPEVGNYLYQLVQVEKAKVTEIKKNEFYVEDERGHKLLVYTGDVRPKYNPQEKLKIGDLLRLTGIAWSYFGQAEVCPRYPEDITVLAPAGEPPETIASITWLGVYNEQQRTYPEPLKVGKGYYLVSKAKKNTPGTVSGLSILEVFNGNEPRFLNAARLPVITESAAEYAALYQPRESGSFNLKALLWNDWSTSAAWRSLAEPKEVGLRILP
jgi:5'-nucleotidase